jgi:hypothetical protein
VKGSAIARTYGRVAGTVAITLISIIAYTVHWTVLLAWLALAAFAFTKACYAVAKDLEKKEDGK